MASALLLRTSAAARTAIKTATASKASLSSLATFSSGRATLPDLPYDYAALEPSISGKIMEIHHSGHHKNYVNTLNTTLDKLEEANAASDIQAQVALVPLLNFNGGGHINHSLFWENLAPSKNGGGDPPQGELAKKIDHTFGGLDSFKTKMNATLAGIQGSGWAWLVKDTQSGDISIKTYANQDPVVGRYVPLLGIDAWEHAYYLQYQNKKAEYFKAIWNVINWKAAEKRLADAS